MKLKVLSFLVFAAFFSLVLSSYHEGPSYFEGFECTGASGNNFNQFALYGCGTANIGCHNTTTSNNVVIELDSAGTAVHSYHPGGTYTVKISATNGNAGTLLPYFGFQMASVLLAGAGDSASVQAGTWDSTSLPSRVHYVHAGPFTAPQCGNTGFPISIVEHSDTIPVTTGTGGPGSAYSEEIQWTAPPSGTGTIVLFGALNTVNGDGQNTGDYNQAATPDTLTEGAALGISELRGTIAGLKVYPALMNENVTVAFDLGYASAVSADLLSIDGKEVKALMTQEAVMGSSFRRSFDVSGLTSGLYLIRVQVGSSVEVSKVVKE